MTLLSWVPDRKVLAGGIAGLWAWGVLAVLAHYNIPPPVDQTLLTGFFAWLISYLTPPSSRDIVKHINDELVNIANDKNMLVTKS